MTEHRVSDKTVAGFDCSARKQGTASGNDPADCNWPLCGCDPHANKVIEALNESGLYLVPGAALPQQIAAARSALGKSFCLSHEADDSWRFDALRGGTFKPFAPPDTYLEEIYEAMVERSQKP